MKIIYSYFVSIKLIRVRYSSPLLFLGCVTMFDMSTSSFAFDNFIAKVFYYSLKLFYVSLFNFYASLFLRRI